MIQSMTGYGRDQKSIDGINITIELKSVNSRYFEFNCRLPKGYLFLENKLKEFTQSKISRGKVEMYVSIESEGQNDIEISVNEAYAQSYISALKSLAKKLKIKNDVSTSNFVNNSDIFKISRKIIILDNLLTYEICHTEVSEHSERIERISVIFIKANQILKGAK